VPRSVSTKYRCCFPEPLTAGTLNVEAVYCGVGVGVGVGVGPAVADGDPEGVADAAGEALGVAENAGVGVGLGTGTGGVQGGTVAVGLPSRTTGVVSEFAHTAAATNTANTQIP
jgi:hypothetical protein